MKNETFKEAFSSVTASDDMVNKAMQIPDENEIRPSFSGWQVARRVAAAAVIVAVLVGAMMLPGPPVTVTDPTGGTQVVYMPLFSVQVYAAGEYVDMPEENGDVIFAGQENTNPNSTMGLINDGKPSFYNPETGEWELITKPPEYKLPLIKIVFWYEDMLKEYDFDINVYVDGELVDLFAKDSDITLGLFAQKHGPDGSPRRGCMLQACFDKQVVLDIECVDKNTGEQLIFQSFRVTPAIYKTDMDSSISNNGSAVLKQNEGYMLEVIYSYQVETKYTKIS